MKKKSKFWTFILSMVPGLGHIYLGFSTRGGIFLTAFIGIATLLSFLFSSLNLYNLNSIIPFVLVIIWLAAIVDAMALSDIINSGSFEDGKKENSEIMLPDYGKIFKQNKKILAMFLSIIPGVGHMYLGLQRQGVELMAGFLLSFYITDWLRLSIFMVLAPIIWFYSMFDVMHKVSGEIEMEDKSIILSTWLSNTNLRETTFLIHRKKTIGYILVIVGVYLLINRFALEYIKPYLDSNITDNLNVGFAALIMIIGGVKLSIGSKSQKAQATNISETQQISE